MVIQSEWACTKQVRLSSRYSVTMTAGPAGFICEWEPDVPNDLTKAELRRYRKARDELVAQIGERLGGSVLIVG